MITIYHNPRCGKSREGLKQLEESKKDFKTRLYLKEPLSKTEIQNLVKKLKLNPIEIVRTNEKIWKENYANKSLSDAEIIEAITENPILLQRPILEDEKTAVLGRPEENIQKFLKL